MPLSADVSFQVSGDSVLFRTAGRTLRSNPRGLDRFNQELRNQFIQEVRNQLDRRMIREIRRQLPRRTGSLRRSIRIRNAENGFSIYSNFYGAFLNPSVRDLINEWVRRNFQSVVNRASTIVEIRNR